MKIYRLHSSIPSALFYFSFPAIIFLFNLKIFAQDRTIPGEALTPYPTITNLAVDWIIQGDDNQNGVVNIYFREKGNKTWEQGMPLRRVQAGEMKGLNNTLFKWGNKHSGSIFNLKPETEYEIKLSLDDPDGGSAEKILVARTRPVPVAGKNAEIIEIQPGKHDTLLTKSGTADNPVVYRCIKGEAIYKYINVQNRKWVFVEGLTVTNTDPDGKGISLNGAENCVVRRCTINSVYGIVAYKPGATNCYFSDNVITGTCVWTNEAMGAAGKNLGEGIEITGPGNVICYNKVTGFRDCISTMEDQGTVNQVCIDIYNNDIYRGVDDGIEADFAFSNCRIFQNRLTNCFVGLSSQPGLGGPTYFIRNVMFNIIHAAFKFKRFSRGDVALHNTIVKVGTGLGGNGAMDYEYFRNNLAIGGPTGGVNWGNFGAGRPYAADIIDPGSHSSFDNDAVGVSGTDYVAKIGGKSFSEVEKHGVEQITLENTFTNVRFPNPPIPERDVPDLRPKAGSKVEDAGVLIPNVNINFKGKGPDCGAYEIGEKLPQYGPRPAGKD
jgi:hypothetical protein